MTTLDLRYQIIGPQGAQHLADVLQQNKIVHRQTSHSIIQSQFYTDTHNT